MDAAFVAQTHGLFFFCLHSVFTFVAGLAFGRTTCAGKTRRALQTACARSKVVLIRPHGASAGIGACKMVEATEQYPSHCFGQTFGGPLVLLVVPIGAFCAGRRHNHATVAVLASRALCAGMQSTFGVVRTRTARQAEGLRIAFGIKTNRACQTKPSTSITVLATTAFLAGFTLSIVVPARNAGKAFRTALYGVGADGTIDALNCVGGFAFGVRHTFLARYGTSVGLKLPWCTGQTIRFSRLSLGFAGLAFFAHAVAVGAHAVVVLPRHACFAMANGIGRCDGGVETRFAKFTGGIFGHARCFIGIFPTGTTIETKVDKV